MPSHVLVIAGYPDVRTLFLSTVVRALAELLCMAVVDLNGSSHSTPRLFSPLLVLEATCLSPLVLCRQRHLYRRSSLLLRGRRESPHASNLPGCPACSAFLTRLARHIPSFSQELNVLVQSRARRGRWPSCPSGTPCRTPSCTRAASSAPTGSFVRPRWP